MALAVEINLCPKTRMLRGFPDKLGVERGLLGEKTHRRRWAGQEWKVASTEARRLDRMCFRKGLWELTNLLEIKPVHWRLGRRGGAAFLGEKGHE